jgi:hypothetical protein
MASMFYAWSLVSSFCYIFPLIWPLWCCIFLLFQHCVMWTCTRYIYTFICVVNKQYKCDYVVIKLTMKTILYCVINTCIWYKILNLYLSFYLSNLVFNATINNISVISVAVTFIGGGKCSTQRKPPTCLKSLTNFITLCCMEYTTPWAGSKFTLGVIGTDCIGSCKSNYQTWSRQPWSNVVKFAYNKLMGTQETCSL